MPFDPAFCMHICNTFICICAYSAMPTTYMLRGCVKIDKVAKKARNLANHHKSCKNNRLKINLLDLSRFVGFLRDSALNLF